MASGTEVAGVRAFPRLAWQPIIAGVLLALAVHVVLGLVGAALGLAAEPTDSRSLGALAGFWGLVTPLIASLLGAWLACRLAAIEEVKATNLHGVMVWCIGLIAGALFLTGTAASGALTAGTAASGNAGFVQRMTGRPVGRSTAGQIEAAQDTAAGAAAKVAGGAAMAALAGLLGAFAGAAIARSRGQGRGMGWRIALQRTAHGQHRPGRGEYGPEEYPDRTYPTEAEQESRDAQRPEGPGEYHH